MGLRVSGWGRLAGRDPGPDKLHSVNIPYMTNEQCKLSWGNMIKNNMLCAGEDYTGSNSNSQLPCNGDSGGPLTLGNTIVGVVSFGQQFCVYRPAVFARVSAILGWLEDNGITNACEETAATTTTPAPAQCFDKYVNCGDYKWACNEWRYGRFMHKPCPKTCNTC